MVTPPNALLLFLHISENYENVEHLKMPSYFNSDSSIWYLLVLFCVLQISFKTISSSYNRVFYYFDNVT